MYKHWKEVSYDEFAVLGLAGVHVCSTDVGQQLHDVEWPDKHWHSRDRSSTRSDIVDPPSRGERFFARIDCEE
jgi:hypothetical protein